MKRNSVPSGCVLIETFTWQKLKCDINGNSDTKTRLLGFHWHAAQRQIQILLLQCKPNFNCAYELAEYGFNAWGKGPILPVNKPKKWIGGSKNSQLSKKALHVEALIKNTWVRDPPPLILRGRPKAELAESN